jgi:hypothetical protein
MDVHQVREDIFRLLTAYCAGIDEGRLDNVAALFGDDGAYGPFKGRGVTGASEVRELLHKTVILYDGVPRTRHMITNVSIDVDADGESGSCKSYVQVLHQGPGGPLQPVVAGTYHDKVHKVDGVWLFAERLMEMQLIGDLSTHVYGNPLKKF